MKSNVDLLEKLAQTCKERGDNKTFVHPEEGIDLLNSGARVVNHNLQDNGMHVYTLIYKGNVFVTLTDMEISEI